MHFKDKEREKLYKNLLKTLKPGGKLMVSDYCRGEKPSPQVQILASDWLSLKRQYNTDLSLVLRCSLTTRLSAATTCGR